MIKYIKMPIHDKNTQRFYKLRYKWIFNHAICWLILIGYELAVFYFYYGKLPSLLVYLLYYICNISLFYCQVELLNVTLNKPKPNYTKLIALFFCELAGFLLIKFSLDLLFTDFSHSKNSRFKDLKAFLNLDLLRNVYYAAFGTLYWTINNINSYQKKADAAEISRLKSANENADLEVRLAKSQNAYLQQQINPHLLFNSLNFIHSSIYKLSREAAENIILLSDNMRYSLEETDADGKINLGKEAEQIENLIKLNQFRFDYPLDISYSMEGNLNSYKIIPLVLLTLAENLFKHGDLSIHTAVIRLSVSESGELKFYTANHKRPLPPVKRLRGIGLENIMIRLNYTYGDKYKLAINETDEIYESELTLNL